MALGSSDLVCEAGVKGRVLAANRLAFHRAGFGMLSFLAAAALFFQTPWLASNQTASHIFRCLLTAGLLITYLQGYRALLALHGDAGLRTLVIGFAVAFGLMALCIPPFNSIDVNCYINSGWQQVGYGLNPYTSTIDDVPNWQSDAMFRPYWTHDYAAYGFLFERLAAALCRLGRGNHACTLFLFKATGLVVFALIGWAGALAARQLRLPAPDRALYLLLWNPLLLILFVVDGHNDLWMALLTMTAVYFVLTDGWVGVLPALVAAAAIKYVSTAILPFALLYLIKRFGWKKAAAGAGLAILLGGLLAWGYVGLVGKPHALVSQVANATASLNSVPAMFVFLSDLGAKLFPQLAPYRQAVAAAIKLAFWTGFTGFYGRLAWMRLCSTSYDPATFLHDSILIHFVLICFVSSKFYPWYLGMFFPLALWLPPGSRLRRAVVAVSCAQLLALTFIGQTNFLNGLVMLVLPLLWAMKPSLFRLCRTRLLLTKSEALVPPIAA